MSDTHTTAQIPDEAVQAREKIEKIAKYFINEGSRDYTQEICYALKNVGLELLDALNDIPHLSAPCAVEVKKLDWNKQNYSEITWVAKTPLGNTQIWLNKGGLSDEQAKAAAQADFERRILSCVATKPVDVLSASEAVYGLLAWLTSRNETVVLGSRHGAAIGAELADAFCKENNLGNCRDNYHEYLNHPSITISQPVDVEAVRKQAFEEAAKVAETVWPNSGPLDVGHGSRIAAAIRALSAEPAQGEQSDRAALAQGGGE